MVHNSGVEPLTVYMVDSGGLEPPEFKHLIYSQARYLLRNTCPIIWRSALQSKQMGVLPTQRLAGVFHDLMDLLNIKRVLNGDYRTHNSTHTFYFTLLMRPNEDSLLFILVFPSPSV